MAHCKAMTKTGEQCNHPAGESGFCHQHDPQSSSRCQAKSRRTGEQCKAPALKGSKFCRFHFGRTHNVANAGRHHLLKHGRYSKALGQKFDRYQQMKQDPEFLRLTDEIALTRVHIAELLDEETRIDLDAEALRGLVDAMAEALAVPNVQAAKSVLARMQLTLARPMDAATVRSELLEHTRTLERLVAAESRNMIQFSNVLTLDQVISIMSKMLLAVQQVVPAERMKELAATVHTLLGSGATEAMIEAKRIELGLTGTVIEGEQEVFFDE
jgi:hypothetical protein